MDAGGLGDPFAFRWVETGVSGIARRRDWDAVQIVELPELADADVEELSFGVLSDGTLIPGDSPISSSVLHALAARISEVLRPPYEAVAARQTRSEWSVAARQLRIDEIELAGLDAMELVIAVGPNGIAELLVDGEEPDERSPQLNAALEALERAGRARYETFVARARHAVGDRWALSVDPL